LQLIFFRYFVALYVGGGCMMDWILALIERYSSKVHVWAWNKRWGKRDRNEWIKGYKKWKKDQ